MKIPLNFVPKGPTDNKSSLVQVMARCQTGIKPLPDKMMYQLHDGYTGIKPLPELMMTPLKNGFVSPSLNELT